MLVICIIYETKLDSFFPITSNLIPPISAIEQCHVFSWLDQTSISFHMINVCLQMNLLRTVHPIVKN